MRRRALKAHPLRAVSIIRKRASLISCLDSGKRSTGALRSRFTRSEAESRKRRRAARQHGGNLTAAGSAYINLKI